MYRFNGSGPVATQHEQAGFTPRAGQFGGSVEAVVKLLPWTCPCLTYKCKVQLRRLDAFSVTKVSPQSHATQG